MSALARWCHRHRLAVLLGWVVLLIALAGALGTAGTNFGDSQMSQNTESATASTLLRHASASSSGDSGYAVFQAPHGKVTDAPVQSEMSGLLDKIAHEPGVASVTSPYTSTGAAQISSDKTIAYANVQFDRDATKAQQSEVSSLALADDGSTVHVTLGGQAFGAQVAAGGPSDAIGIVLVFVILLLVFRAVWVAVLPIITAVAGVGTGALTVMLLSHLITIPSTALTLGALIGLGVGIDYALFIVNRHRGNLMAGMSTGQSVAASLNTSGRAVVFAGLTVVAALLGMTTLNLGEVTGMAEGAAVTVVLTVLAAVTLLPALLGFIGPKVLSRAQRRRLADPADPADPADRADPADPADPADRAGHAAPERTGVWPRWAAQVQARPKAMAAAGLVVLVALAFPALSLRLGSADDGNLPASSTNRQAYDLLSEGFGPGFNGPLQIAVQVHGDGDQAAQTKLVTALEHTPGIVSVSERPVNAAQGVSEIIAMPSTSPEAAATSTLISHLRSDVIPQAEQGSTMKAYVGGTTAGNDDFASTVTGKLPLFIAVITVLGLLLLIVAFRSLLIPLLGAVLNVLSIGVAFGATVLVFQDGFGVSLLGAGSGGPVEAFVPPMIIGVVFGLSMDYLVFLVSRMREEWVHTGDNQRAVRVGHGETGRVIAVAAAIMFFVFGSFVFGGARVIAEFGVALSVGIVLDALLIRMVVVPALMHLFGRANWWLPRWLDRALPTISVEGESHSPAPAVVLPRSDRGAAEPVSDGRR
ncbi:MMPL family transporter [Streptacidiphilus jiangxiensis]|uniref:Putative drug exporter of the RND superfamily n=1 Tax=Streptacidiphilus jiangxiensis TaxID=235985 RepID=A0A1H7WC02_STRJI|nr:MMPL family transporter [Streptacidiphilus jiangxiensis]SEM18589.1 putative drug exporter of the RND superfamily [Streptacidiphilus jiangxiensis]